MKKAASYVSISTRGIAYPFKGENSYWVSAVYKVVHQVWQKYKDEEIQRW